MKYGLEDNIIEKINNVFAKYEKIDKVLLFGSRSKNTFHKDSDIDLAIFGKGINDLILEKIRENLNSLNLDYEIDVNLFENITNEIVKQHILERNVVFYIKLK
ncbi:MAG: nucleotidyltransferase domain-containing protein [Bacteroidales bacterium]|jgi:predicted nucleotidyltransferase|nr:nucleotidyltransferase domain-containing protein [Bacteroidales bacterium]